MKTFVEIAADKLEQNVIAKSAINSATLITNQVFRQDFFLRFVAMDSFKVKPNCNHYLNVNFSLIIKSHILTDVLSILLQQV